MTYDVTLATATALYVPSQSVSYSGFAIAARVRVLQRLLGLSSSVDPGLSSRIQICGHAVNFARRVDVLREFYCV